MKVLMISPGPPNETTSGLGIAAERLGAQLATKVELIVIQPQDISIPKSEDQSIDSGKFEDGSVVRDLTRIQVAGKVSPYIYSNTVDEEPADKAESPVKNELDLFSKAVVEAGVNLDFDLIYAHDWVTFEAAIQLKRLTKKPLVVHAHSLDVDRVSSKNHSWIYELEKRGFEIANTIIAVSNYTAKRIHEYYTIPEDKIQVVYNGYDPTLFPDYEKVFTDPVVLFVGRLSGQKSPQTFIEIADKILVEKDNVRFVVAGDGAMRNSLIDMAAHKGIGDKIHFTGYVNRKELGKIFAEATIFCMPSMSEPFGLSAIEAAAAGLPVVVSRQSGAIEVLPEALVADYGDIQGFVNHIKSLMDGKAATEKIIKKNQEAANSLTWEKAGDQLYKVLEGVN